MRYNLIKLFLTSALLQTMLLASFTGVITDTKTLKPIKGAMISDSVNTVKSDENGTFNLDTQENSAHIKSYGYRALKITNDTNTSLLKLEPIKVKALYLSFWAASGNSKTMKKIMKIIDEKEINALVIDVKNEYGSTVYKTSFKQANDYGAHKKRTNRNIQKFMKLMKLKNIYTIARIVPFKDELHASNNPCYAVKNAKGEIWRNHDNMAWVDPCNVKSHDYTINIAEEAAKVGFDEINFDYIRFPAKTGLQFSQVSTEEKTGRSN